jgi:hypothetical protein
VVFQAFVVLVGLSKRRCEPKKLVHPTMIAQNMGGNNQLPEVYNRGNV